MYLSRLFCSFVCFFSILKPLLIYCSINSACSTIIMLIPIFMKRNRTLCFLVCVLSRTYVTTYNIGNHTKVSEFQRAMKCKNKNRTFYQNCILKGHKRFESIFSNNFSWLCFIYQNSVVNCCNQVMTSSHVIMA